MLKNKLSIIWKKWSAVDGNINFVLFSWSEIWRLNLLAHVWDKSNWLMGQSGVICRQGWNGLIARLHRSKEWYQTVPIPQRLSLKPTRFLLVFLDASVVLWQWKYILFLPVTCAHTYHFCLCGNHGHRTWSQPFPLSIPITWDNLPFYRNLHWLYM